MIGAGGGGGWVVFSPLKLRSSGRGTLRVHVGIYLEEGLPSEGGRVFININDYPRTSICNQARADSRGKSVRGTWSIAKND